MRLGPLNITLARDKGPFEAQRPHNGVTYNPNNAFEHYYGGVKETRREAIRDARRLGHGAIVRNTRNGAVVWEPRKAA